MRRSYSRMGLVASMEQQAEVDQLTVIPAPETPLGANADSMETELVEITEEAAALQADDAAVDQTVAVAETLETVGEALEVAEEAGGVSPEAAAALEPALECLYGLIGASARRRPSLESYGGTNSRRAATNLSMEDVKETAKKAWDAVIAAIKKAIQFISDFFFKIFNNADKLKKRAEELVKQAGASKAEAKPLQDGRIFAALQVGGKVDGVAAAKMAVEYAEHTAAAQAGMVAAADKALADIESGKFEDNPADQLKNVASALKASKVDGATAGGSQPEFTETLRTEELPGGKAIFVTIPTTETSQGPLEPGKLAALYEGVSARIGDFDAKRQAPEKADVQGVNAQDAGEIGKMVVTLADKLIAYKAGLDKIVKTKKSLVSAMEKQAREATKSTEGTKEMRAGLATGMRRAGAAVARFIDQPSKDFAIYGLRTGKSLIDLGELSLKGGEAKADDKKPEAAAAAA